MPDWGGGGDLGLGQAGGNRVAAAGKWLSMKGTVFTVGMHGAERAEWGIWQNGYGSEYAYSQIATKNVEVKGKASSTPERFQLLQN